MADTSYDWRAGLRKRWPYYAVAAVLFLLALAWFDGGEESIRPIEQPIALPSGGGEQSE
ncbi:MAG: hypothetical protein ACX930_00360 [Erythrobacter sp.]